jgi:hypothetical protein
MYFLSEFTFPHTIIHLVSLEVVGTMLMYVVPTGESPLARIFIVDGCVGK